MARRPAGPSSREGGRRGRTGSIAPEAATSPKAPAAKVHTPKTAASAEPPDPDLVLLGEFGRAQGLSGEVRLKSYTGDPLAIAGYGPLVTMDGRTLTLDAVRPAPGAATDMLIARVKGVGGRNAAEALNRVALYIPRDRLGAPADSDEFFTTDLIGASAVDADGALVGTVVAVPNYGGGDLLELRPACGGATALLPFTKDFVPSVDVGARRITVVLPEDFFAPAAERPADDPG